MASADQVARWAKTVSRRTAANPALEFLERVGYIVRGLLYGAMGTLALGLAIGVGGAATDQSGSLMMLARGPAGRVLLIAVITGLGAYSLWGFVRAIFDPLQRGDNPAGIAERLGFVWSGIAYASIVVLAARMLAGSGANQHDSTQVAIAHLLNYPAGHLATIGVGIIAIGVGLGQFVDAYRAIFKKDLKREQMSKAEKEIVDTLGRLGMISRGVVFSLVGWFVLQGGLHRDPSQVHGYGGAFLFLLAQPFGRLLLGIIAVGFIALGIHSLACARWAHLMGSRS
jgi:hypothetical protein